MFAFEVKFYPPDPAILQEDITRFGEFCFHDLVAFYIELFQQYFRLHIPLFENIISYTYSVTASLCYVCIVVCPQFQINISQYICYCQC